MAAALSITSAPEKNLIQAWAELARALKNEDANVFALKNGNLDTGKDDDGKYVCWT